jgi:hypothetical protein
VQGELDEQGRARSGAGVGEGLGRGVGRGSGKARLRSTTRRGRAREREHEESERARGGRCSAFIERGLERERVGRRGGGNGRQWPLMATIMPLKERGRGGEGEENGRPFPMHEGEEGTRGRLGGATAWPGAHGCGAVARARCARQWRRSQRERREREEAVGGAQPSVRGGRGRGSGEATSGAGVGLAPPRTQLS